jgi:hypothetical protein
MKKPDNFADIKHPQIKAYNRAVTALTINQEEGADSTRAYFEQFDEEERRAVGVMLMAISVDREAITKRIQALTNENYN